MSEGASYLELVQVIQAQGGVERVLADLAQLFRGLAFNVVVDERDGIAGGDIDQRRAQSQPMRSCPLSGSALRLPCARMA